MWVKKVAKGCVPRPHSPSELIALLQRKPERENQNDDRSKKNYVFDIYDLNHIERQ